MKKILTVISAMAVILSFAGCSSSKETNLAESMTAVESADAHSGTSVSSTGAGTTGAVATTAAKPTPSADKADGSSVVIPSETGAETYREPGEYLEESGVAGGTVSTGAADSSDSVVASTKAPALEESAVEKPIATTVPAAFGPSGDYDYDIADDSYVDMEPSYAAVDGDYGWVEAAEPFVEECPPIIIDLPEQPDPQSGLLTGGEWNDNDHWHDWVSLYQKQDDWSRYDEEWGFSLDFRYEVKVTSVGKPVEGAKVTCDTAFADAVTDNTGTAYLFFDNDKLLKQPMNLTVTYGNITDTTEQTSCKDTTIEVELQGAEAKKEKKLDLMIMCDTTGSMYDELDYLKVELVSILNSIERYNANLPTRVSVNFYRDEGDEYVVRDFPFTTDFKQAEQQMSEQWSDGGGDFPEAVHKALENALKGHEWDEDAVKLMFIVLDAPPHSEDPQIVSYVRQLTALASQMGVRIIPIASSGIDKTTEFLLRNIAFTTGGTYTFLTDDSGVSVGGHIEPTIGDYEVEKLNDMIVRIVSEYLA